MTDLERAVVETMARLNTPMRPGDPPYPACLLNIAQAVIEVVRDHGGQEGAPNA